MLCYRASPAEERMIRRFAEISATTQQWEFRIL
jgi:hypothetical protein